MDVPWNIHHPAMVRGCPMDPMAMESPFLVGSEAGV